MSRIGNTKSSGNISVSIAGGGGGGTVFSSGVVLEDRRETTANFSFPAGGYYIEIRNTSISNINVNGEIVSPGGSFIVKHELNRVDNTQDFTKAVNVVASNNSYWWHAQYPSDSGVDPTTFNPV